MHELCTWHNKVCWMGVASDLCLMDYLMKYCVALIVYLSQYSHDFAEVPQEQRISLSI